MPKTTEKKSSVTTCATHLFLTISPLVPGAPVMPVDPAGPWKLQQVFTLSEK